MAESMTSIPELIARHGSIAKYRFDTGCEKHVIFNGRLMTHQKTSPVLYTRRGVTKTEMANGQF